jgi:aspartyl-tRNA(Asn)/glutamyl-tRNA(Gln) amidotransferase subunit C
MISEAEVARVALLARVSLTPDETKQLAEQLSSILGAFESVSKIDTTGVEPLVTPVDIEPRWRDDVARTWETPAVAVANAPAVAGNLFQVPPVVG